MKINLSRAFLNHIFRLLVKIKYLNIDQSYQKIHRLCIKFIYNSFREILQNVLTQSARDKIYFIHASVPLTNTSTMASIQPNCMDFINKGQCPILVSHVTKFIQRTYCTYNIISHFMVIQSCYDQPQFSDL